MATITLKSRDGKDKGSLELADAVFGIQPNVPVMHQVVTAQLAHARSGTHKAKTPAKGPRPTATTKSMANTISLMARQASSSRRTGW